MKKLQFLLILLVAGALFVPAVSAETYLDEEIVEYQDMGSTYSKPYGSAMSGGDTYKYFRFKDISQYTNLAYIIFDHTLEGPVTYPPFPEGRSETTYTINGKTKPAVVYYQVRHNILGQPTGWRLTIFPQNWDVTGEFGDRAMSIGNWVMQTGFSGSTSIPADTPFWFGTQNSRYTTVYQYKTTVAANKEWRNRITVTDFDSQTYKVEIFRDFGEVSYASTLNLINDGNIEFTDVGSHDFYTYQPMRLLDTVQLISGSSIYNRSIINQDSPGIPTDQPTLRNGSVTMTDNNGTTITGFNVTAVNRDTEEEYTVATETDVAVMTLPMDRTIRLKNPQTGEYEETVIGYYRFFGQSPGYKMLSEDGIQVSVVPEKYTSYQLCDIRVTQESGYLTGKHQFQIRSRTDNTVLQTGTISAKSATTGEWYNTTVSGGIATLILPYDTSNSISEYAGNYAVYATSPGYQDSEFGTQIVVMPHTVSEIRPIHLTPIGGIPTPGNVTLRIQVFSETGPGVVNAEIFIAGIDGAGESVWDTYTASSTGYLSVSVPGNSTYNIVASGAGYYDSARRVEVFTEDPALIEIKLYFSGGPTVEPTSQPTGWLTPIPTPTPRPTEVAPNNSPIDNFILMFVNMGFDSAMALWLTGMFLICIASVIGHLIAGKFGAMLGAPVGIVATTGLGLIPFWGMVILLVIAALVIAKMVMR